MLKSRWIYHRPHLFARETVARARSTWRGQAFYALIEHTEPGFEGTAADYRTRLVAAGLTMPADGDYRWPLAIRVAIEKRILTYADRHIDGRAVYRRI